MKTSKLLTLFGLSAILIQAPAWAQNPALDAAKQKKTKTGQTQGGKTNQAQGKTEPKKEVVVSNTAQNDAEEAAKLKALAHTEAAIELEKQRVIAEADAKAKAEAEALAKAEAEKPAAQQLTLRDFESAKGEFSVSNSKDEIEAYIKGPSTCIDRIKSSGVEKCESKTSVGDAKSLIKDATKLGFKISYQGTKEEPTLDDCLSAHASDAKSTFSKISRVDKDEVAVLGIYNTEKDETEVPSKSKATKTLRKIESKLAKFNKATDCKDCSKNFSAMSKLESELLELMSAADMDTSSIAGRSADSLNKQLKSVIAKADAAKDAGQVSTASKDVAELARSLAKNKSEENSFSSEFALLEQASSSLVSKALGLKVELGMGQASAMTNLVSHIYDDQAMVLSASGKNSEADVSAALSVEYRPQACGGVDCEKRLTHIKNLDIFDPKVEELKKLQQAQANAHWAAYNARCPVQMAATPHCQMQLKLTMAKVQKERAEYEGIEKAQQTAIASLSNDPSSQTTANVGSRPTALGIPGVSLQTVSNGAQNMDAQLAQTFAPNQSGQPVAMQNGVNAPSSRPLIPGATITDPYTHWVIQ